MEQHSADDHVVDENSTSDDPISKELTADELSNAIQDVLN